MIRYEKYFKLSSNLSMKNMVGFNEEKKLVKMNSALNILEIFSKLRL